MKNWNKGINTIELRVDSGSSKPLAREDCQCLIRGRHNRQIDDKTRAFTLPAIDTYGTPVRLHQLAGYGQSKTAPTALMP